MGERRLSARVALEESLAQLPWPLVLAGVSILVVVLFFRTRYDVFQDLGLRRAELAILCLGPIAGIAVNVPLYQSGGGVLAINLGGALLPLLMVALWVKRARLDLPLALAGVLVVSVVAKLIVAFDPEQGIYTTFPQLFAPSLVALAFAMAVSVRRPLRAVPLAYCAGSMGSLLGADVYNIPVILEHLGGSELSVVSIGGAGVFDMVYLAGMVAMAAALLLVGGMLPKRAGAALEYPPPPPRAPDAAILWQRFQLLNAPNARERAQAALALSDLHLKRHDYAQSLGQSVLAVDAMLDAREGLKEAVRTQANPALRADLAALEAAQRTAAAGPVPRRVAGAANTAAKLVVATLEPLAGLPSRLVAEGP